MPKEINNKNNYINYNELYDNVFSQYNSVDDFIFVLKINGFLSYKKNIDHFLETLQSADYLSSIDLIILLDNSIDQTDLDTNIKDQINEILISKIKQVDFDVFSTLIVLKNIIYSEDFKNKLEIIDLLANKIIDAIHDEDVLFLIDTLEESDFEVLNPFIKKLIGSVKNVNIENSKILSLIDKLKVFKIEDSNVNLLIGYLMDKLNAETIIFDILINAGGFLKEEIIEIIVPIIEKKNLTSEEACYFLLNIMENLDIGEGSIKLLATNLVNKLTIENIINILTQDNVYLYKDALDIIISRIESEELTTDESQALLINVVKHIDVEDCKPLIQDLVQNLAIENILNILALTDNLHQCIIDIIISRIQSEELKSYESQVLLINIVKHIDVENYKSLIQDLVQNLTIENVLNILELSYALDKSIIDVIVLRVQKEELTPDVIESLLINISKHLDIERLRPLVSNLVQKLNVKNILNILKQSFRLGKPIIDILIAGIEIEELTSDEIQSLLINITKHIDICDYKTLIGDLLDRVSAKDILNILIQDDVILEEKFINQ